MGPVKARFLLKPVIDLFSTPAFRFPNNFYYKGILPPFSLRSFHILFICSRSLIFRRHNTLGPLKCLFFAQWKSIHIWLQYKLIITLLSLVSPRTFLTADQNHQTDFIIEAEVTAATHGALSPSNRTSQHSPTSMAPSSWSYCPSCCQNSRQCSQSSPHPACSTAVHVCTCMHVRSTPCSRLFYPHPGFFYAPFLLISMIIDENIFLSACECRRVELMFIYKKNQINPAKPTYN